MERRNFAEVLRSAKIDIKKEYSRLHSMFYINANEDGFIAELLYDICSENFRAFPGRGTCISLDAFDDTYGFNFAERPKDFDINYLINFCEYAYNIALFTASDY